MRAQEVLRQNDMGRWTRAAPTLYPHQWSWDSAFIAVGLAHLDTRRAAQELRTLFAHQWKTGKVPHIVFNPKAPPYCYYPGADHWACAARAIEDAVEVRLVCNLPYEDRPSLVSICIPSNATRKLRGLRVAFSAA